MCLTPFNCLSVQFCIIIVISGGVYYHVIAANLHNHTPFIVNRTIYKRFNIQLQIPLIDEINLRQHQQLESCEAIAAKIKASANQPRP